MCGIVGVLSMGTKKDDLKTEIMRFLFTELLQVTEERGKDATGMSALFSDGMSYLQKGPVTATEFIGNLGDDETSYNMFMKNCTEYIKDNDILLRLFIGHCRKSSVGGAFDNVNNHPIKVNEIIGVHNGTLENHNKIFTNLGCKRDGVVDSEAIMRLLDYHTGHCTEPFTIEGLEETARRLEGAYSVIAYNANNPYQLCMMRKERPFELALLKDLGILLISSDKAFFLKALYQYNKMAYLFRDTYKPIKVTEVESYTFPLDNVGIVDLTKEITLDTTIEELIIKKDIFKTTKLWKMPAKKTVYYGGYNNRVDTGKKNDTKSTTNATNTTSTTTGAAANSAEVFKGKVFSKKLNAYVDETSLEAAKTEGAKVIEVASGKVQNVGKDNLVDFTEVKHQEIKATVQPVPIIFKEVKTVDSTFAEALKASTEQENYRARYSSGKEVIEAFDIKSIDTLDSIPAFALINKAKETIYKEAFVDGAMWFKQNHTGQEVVAQDNPTKAVRIAKQVVEIFGVVIEQLAAGKTEDFASKIFAELQKRKNTELTLDNIRQVFSKGNTMSCKALVALEDVI